MMVISIHALLAESDCQRSAMRSSVHPFLSTLSLRRATAPQQENGQAATISIHALLAESDLGAVQPCTECDISIHALLAESDAGQDA